MFVIGELPFWQHALCGSIAGVMEHIALFPLDTIKTRLQTQSAYENSSPGQNGFSRLKNGRLNTVTVQRVNTPINGVINRTSGTNTDITHISNTYSTDMSKSVNGVINKFNGRMNGRLNRDSIGKINERLSLRSNKLVNKIISNRNIATEALVTQMNQISPISPIGSIGSVSSVGSYSGNISNIAANLTEFAKETVSSPANTDKNSGIKSSTINNKSSSILNSSLSKSNTFTTAGGSDAQVVPNRNITSKILKHMKPMNATRPGFYSNLFRGSNVIIAGCVPAHVLYFTVYEKIKSAGSIAASGAAATFCHDLVLTPADVIKQRLQLGCYRSSRDCLYNIISQEGVRALFRSFHITLLMNVPYHSLLVSIMHLVKQVDGSRSIAGVKDSSLSSVGANNTNGNKDVENYKHFIYAGIGGAVAGALTTPFDVIKTRLQTQACRMDTKRPKLQIKYKNVITTFENIYRKEGLRGFMRGVTTRIGMCTPSAAISWGTYESLKNLIKLID
ncbi:mitochondrial carrier protein [Theileria orientalis]|uniref:Mitochondrial carrier protein n=1 Tax=Theileria orientalis TaxID=68886 RepID=A0A976M8N4_THEOR|nr:mitochondrial carrier protein [Theileria orientalis]